MPVRKFYDDDALWFSVTTLGEFVASGFGQVTSAVLSDHRPDLDPIFLELASVGDDDVLYHEISCRVRSPAAARSYCKGWNAETALLVRPEIGTFDPAREAHKS
jgi:hypothetical protein